MSVLQICQVPGSSFAWSCNSLRISRQSGIREARWRRANVQKAHPDIRITEHAGIPKYTHSFFTRVSGS